MVCWAGRTFGHTKKTLRKFQSFSETKVVFFFGGLNTRLKVNIFEPNNEGLEDDFPFSIGWIVGSHAVYFQGCKLDVFCVGETFSTPKLTAFALKKPKNRLGPKRKHQFSGASGFREGNVECQSLVWFRGTIGVPLKGKWVMPKLLIYQPPANAAGLCWAWDCKQHGQKHHQKQQQQQQHHSLHCQQHGEKHHQKQQQQQQQPTAAITTATTTTTTTTATTTTTPAATTTTATTTTTTTTTTRTTTTRTRTRTTATATRAAAAAATAGSQQLTANSQQEQQHRRGPRGNRARDLLDVGVVVVVVVLVLVVVVVVVVGGGGWF